jgi:hypothetical protein
MTKSDYPGWDQVEYIHHLQKELEIVDMVLSIAEYGYKEFFANYSVYLQIIYKGRQTLQDAFFDQCFELYTSPFYSQLWRGLDMKPYGHLEERKKKNYKKFEWFDEVLMGTPAKEKGIRMSDIFKT